MPNVEMPRIIAADEDADGFVTATVAFEDGQNQSVRLPNWATKQNILDEAVRIRTETESRLAKKKKREDLVK